MCGSLQSAPEFSGAEMRSLTWTFQEHTAAEHLAYVAGVRPPLVLQEASLPDMSLSHVEIQTKSCFPIVFILL